MATDAQHRRASGTALLLAVVALWTVSSFLTSNILETADQPFLITWLCTASFSLYLVPPLVGYVRSHWHGWVSGQRLGPATAVYAAVPTRAGWPDGRPDQLPLTTRETAVVACQFCFLWFAANYTMNASLGLTTVSSMTILSATSALFTLMFGRLVGIETLNVVKLAAVLMSIAGVAMVSRSDSDLASQTASVPDRSRLVGDGLALSSAILYGIYAVFLKLKVGHEDRISMPLFFGMVGACNILCLWPFGVLLHLLDIEPLAFPSRRRVWVSMLINALITFVSDYLYLLAMLKTSAVLATLALCLTIPAAVIGDLAQGTAVGNMVLFTVGASMVVSAFVLAGLKPEPSTALPLLRDEDIEGSDSVG